MTFLNELAKNTNWTLTENMAITNKSTLDPALDFFALGGALRGQTEQFDQLFRLAYAEEPLSALRTLFYLRDVRGGQGERVLFRSGLKDLFELDYATYKFNLELVPEYGRWDDIFATGITPPVVEIVRGQLDQDLTLKAGGNSISLLAKWLPSENASSKETRALARELIEALGWTERKYRKVLSELRAHIYLLEQDMSANRWEDINFSRLPSQAHLKHVKAFYRHLPITYPLYLASVQRGEQKINTDTLYTYQVYNSAMSNGEAADVMWDNLPDYTRGNPALVMADVSGSMFGYGTPTPISVSVSLALYFAERNQGPFNGYFMTFSEQPELVKVRGNSLRDKLRNISTAGWGMNTNLERALEAIRLAAVSAGATPEEVPATLYIISDMEFDRCTRNPNATLFENAKQRFEASGYQLPHIVFWNVQARQKQVPVTKFDGNVTLVSGSSQSTFRYVMEGKSPRELMDDVINSERYSPIKLAL